MKLLLTIALLFSFTTQADTFDKQFQEGLRKGACAKLNLTPEQKATLKTKMIAMRHTMIDLRAAMRHARLDLKVALMSGGDLEAVTDAIVAAKGAKVRARLGFLGDVMNNVLEEDQRRPGLRCLRKMMRKGKGHRRGGRGHHRRGPRRGMRPQA